MSYIDEFIKWLEKPHKREWRPREVHLLAVTNKKTGKVCDIAVTHDVPPLKERKWKLQCMYPESEYSYERMQTDISSSVEIRIHNAHIGNFAATAYTSEESDIVCR